MTVTLTDKQRQILAGNMTPKFLATLSADGEPNVVPVLSLCPVEPGVAGFAEFMLWKSRKNLDETRVAAFAALDMKLAYVSAHGDFRGIVTSGPVFDLMATQEMFRYNPYNGIRGAGTIGIEAVDAEGAIPTFTLLGRYLKARRAASSAVAAGPLDKRSPAMPLRVADKFARLKALKAVAWVVNEGGVEGKVEGAARSAVEDTAGNRVASPGRAGNGSARGVRVLPAGGVFPVGRQGLVVSDPALYSAVPEGSRVAVAVITLDPIAYQVKGAARRWRGVLLVEVDEAYTATPPVPGRKL